MSFWSRELGVDGPFSWQLVRRRILSDLGEPMVERVQNGGRTVVAGGNEGSFVFVGAREKQR
jgi:hypothetical protein